MLVLSPQATKFGLGASNMDVPEQQNSKIMLPGPENAIRCPKHNISTKKKNCLGILYWDNLWIMFG